MASLHLVGMFAVANGRREAITTSAGKTTNYIVYNSAIRANDNTGTAIQIRHFSLEPILPNDTVVLIQAKAAFPTSTDGPIILLTLHLFTFPGDPSSDDYDNYLPDFQTPIAFAIGHISSVSSRSESLRFFTLATSSFISGTSFSFTVKCVFHNTVRWASPPNVTPSSCIALTGTMQHISSSRQFSIAIEDLTLGLASQTTMAPPSSPSKRKFAAYLPSTDANAADSSSSTLSTESSPITTNLPLPSIVQSTDENASDEVKDATQEQSKKRKK